MLLDSSKLALLGLDPHILMLIGVAFMLVVMAVLLLARLRGRLRARLQTRAQGSSALEEQPLEQTPEELFAAAGAPLMSCTAEVLERRPLSEAQWDSPVPAAWTVFRLQIEEGARFNLGLLLPVQHRELRQLVDHLLPCRAARQLFAMFQTNLLFLLPNLLWSHCLRCL